MLIGDVTVVGRVDLLVGRKRKEMHFYEGVAGQELFAKWAQKIDIRVPYDGEYVWLGDLNKDGKQDVLMQDPSDTEPNRVILLVSK